MSQNLTSRNKSTGNSSAVSTSLATAGLGPGRCGLCDCLLGHTHTEQGSVLVILGSWDHAVLSRKCWSWDTYPVSQSSLGWIITLFNQGGLGNHLIQSVGLKAEVSGVHHSSAAEVIQQLAPSSCCSLGSSGLSQRLTVQAMSYPASPVQRVEN